MDDRGSGIGFDLENCTLLQRVQTACGAHPVSYSVGTEALSWRGREWVGGVGGLA